MAIDGKKKTTKGKQDPESSSSKKKDQVEEGLVSCEDEEGSEYEPGSDQEESDQEDESDIEENLVEMIRKKAPNKEIKKTKKRRHDEEDHPNAEEEEEEIIVKKVKHDRERKHVETVAAPGTSKKSIKKTEVFNDSNLDFDLFKSSPTNVVSRRIRVASNLIVTCRMISQAGNNLSYDYAAITFQRKTQNEKMFEFVIPLNLTPRLVQAMQYIIAENPKFFDAEKWLCNRNHCSLSIKVIFSILSYWIIRSYRQWLLE